MTYEQCLAKYGLPIKPEMRPEILRMSLEMTQREKELCASKSTEENNWDNFDGELRKLLLEQIFSVGVVEDCIHIWRAKNAGFDAFCYLDMQLLLGAGLNETLRYLEALAPQNTEANEMLNYIRSCMQTGDLDDFTPEGWLRYCQAYHSDERSKDAGN